MRFFRIELVNYAYDVSNLDHYVTKSIYRAWGGIWGQDTVIIENFAVTSKKLVEGFGLFFEIRDK